MAVTGDVCAARASSTALPKRRALLSENSTVLDVTSSGVSGESAKAAVQLKPTTTLLVNQSRLVQLSSNRQAG